MRIILQAYEAGGALLKCAPDHSHPAIGGAFRTGQVTLMGAIELDIEDDVYLDQALTDMEEAVIDACDQLKKNLLDQVREKLTST